MDGSLDTDTWRLVQLKPNCLHIAYRNLVRQGFRVFCPMEKTTRRRSGRFVATETALFPGYLFLGSPEAAAPIRVVNSTYGVSRVVSFSSEIPAEVPLQIVLGLMARCDEQGVLRTDELQKGDEIRVLGGPFSDFIGKVESLGPQQRVWVLLDLLGGSTRVAVKQDTVQRT